MDSLQRVHIWEYEFSMNQMLEMNRNNNGKYANKRMNTGENIFKNPLGMCPAEHGTCSCFSPIGMDYTTNYKRNCFII